MADKEATVFVIDISEFMAQRRPGASETTLEWCLEYLWDKLGIKIMAARKTDYVAVVAVGSAETDHTMGAEEAYCNIRIIMPFPRRDAEELKTYTFAKSHVEVMMSELKPSNVRQGDLLSAAIIGVQMLMEFCLKLKFKKHLILITKGELETDFTDAEAVATQIVEQNIEFSVLGVGFDDPEYGFKEENKSARKRTNEDCFRKLCTETEGVFATYDEVADSLKMPRIKPVRPVTTFRGMITLGDTKKFVNTIEIPVERYPKTKQAKVPSASKYSMAAETRSIVTQATKSQRDISRDDDENATSTHQVYPARTYRLQDGEELPDTSKLERGYAYGQTVVPISKADEDFLQFGSVAGYLILGFVDSESHARYLGMGEVSTIISQKANRSASLALSSLIHALFESEVYALARFVRKDNAPPAMVLLAPNLEPEFESLLEVSLPFAEDIRQYKFAPLDKVKTSGGQILEKHRYLPTDKLNDAMDDYLDHVQLNNDSPDQFAPDETFSYGIHRTMQAIMFRAFHSSSKPVPEPAEILTRNSRMSEDRLNIARSSLDTLIQVADTKKVPLRAASKRKRGAEQEEPVKTGIDLDSLLSIDQPDEGKEEETDRVGAGIIASIGQANPAQDFEMMMRDDALVDAAFQQIQPIIMEMVQYSLGDQTYASTINAFKSFRRHAIMQEEAELYNFFLERFNAKMTEENRQDFLTLLHNAGLGEITAEEANGVTI